MPKNVVVCCDGTSNEYSKANTNVVKLFFALVSDPAQQVVYYHPGLGTIEPAGALTPMARKVTRTLGLAFGYGLASDVRDAYEFIMKNFEEGDYLFLFGFSRGAYTARAVASLLKMYGLIRHDNEALVPYAVRMMNAIGIADRLPPSAHKAQSVRDVFELADGFKQSFSISCKPWFVGVWDTVSSVGGATTG